MINTLWWEQSVIVANFVHFFHHKFTSGCVRFDGNYFNSFQLISTRLTSVVPFKSGKWNALFHNESASVTTEVSHLYDKTYTLVCRSWIDQWIADALLSLLTSGIDLTRMNLKSLRLKCTRCFHKCRSFLDLRRRRRRRRRRKTTNANRVFDVFLSFDD